MATPFLNTPFEAPDSMFELKAAFDADTSPLKINLGPGAYLDNEGKPWILKSVAAAEKQLQAAHWGHEYLPILGLPLFRESARKIAFGADSTLLSSPNIATLQAISGTGAIRMAIQYLKLFYSADATVYVSNPSWSNHRVMFEYAGFTVKDYPYYDNAAKEVCFDKMLDALETAPPGSIVVLHACAHNPTGCDLTHEQWIQLADTLHRKKNVPLLDSAYQGFATGSLENDGWAIRRLFETDRLTGIVCQSFSKSMGLYGERVGAMHVVVPTNSDPAVIRAIESQIGWISRKEVSTPVRYGATIASSVISNNKLYAMWQDDLTYMSTRIRAMRDRVRSGLLRRGTPGNWDHVVNQIGMFSYTGLSVEQVRRLREKHIYLADSGRISLSGLNDGNLEYFCDMVDEAVRS